MHERLLNDTGKRKYKHERKKPEKTYLPHGDSLLSH